jgi:hypothetical protein
VQPTGTAGQAADAKGGDSPGGDMAAGDNTSMRGAPEEEAAGSKDSGRSEGGEVCVCVCVGGGGGVEVFLLSGRIQDRVGRDGTAKRSVQHVLLK